MAATAGAPDRSRPLPPCHLARELHTYEFTGRLPHGLTIEVSEIESAFGVREAASRFAS
ncbi:hypothetical protein SAMN05216467_0307 [Cellulomonas sp. KH9]|nr:hypothetical protein SAMN05216467_0307 [Cellulomonas sp. KH9]